MGKDLVVDVRLESWVIPILKDMATLHAVGFIRRETLAEIARLIIEDGVTLGPIRRAEW